MVSTPLAIQPIVQVGAMDCGIAAIAMYKGLPYQTVSKAALEIVPDVHQTGLTRTEMLKVAALVGHPLKRVKVKDLTKSGILFLSGGNNQYHVVVLFEGVIINPADGLVWNTEAYLTTLHYNPITLYM